MNVASRRSAPYVKRVAARRMSGFGHINPELELQTAAKWKSISKVASVVVGAFAVFQLIKSHDHPHPINMPYAYKRTKAFPWGDGNTPFMINLTGGKDRARNGIPQEEGHGHH